MSKNVEQEVTSAAAIIRKSLGRASVIRNYQEVVYKNVCAITNETVMNRVMVSVCGAEYRDHWTRSRQQRHDQILDSMRKDSR